MSWVQIQLDQNHMATNFEFRVSCDAARTRAAELALSDAHQTISRLEDELSEFRESSPVFQLNQAEAFITIPITENIRLLWDLAEAAKLKSDGGFNPLCKSRDILGEVKIARGGKCFYKTSPGTHLSFGAIGKGFALDRARVVLEQAGFSDYLLSAGGSSVLISGFAAPRTPWKWAWSWKKDEHGENCGKRFVHTTGHPIALGVSGTMEQGNHILGKQKQKSLSALVAHASAAKADALSTALFVNGWENIGGLHDPLHAMPLAWMDTEENLHWNGDFQRLWGSPCS
jgi:thiamine biosynthesis lipoprotein ApbE